MQINGVIAVHQSLWMRFFSPYPNHVRCAHCCCNPFKMQKKDIQLYGEWAQCLFMTSHKWALSINLLGVSDIQCCVCIYFCAKKNICKMIKKSRNLICTSICTVSRCSLILGSCSTLNICNLEHEDHATNSYVSYIR